MFELKNAVDQVPEPLDIFSGADIPYGLFVRCAESINLQNCKIDMSAASGEWRRGFIAEKSPSLRSTPDTIQAKTNAVKAE